VSARFRLVDPKGNTYLERWGFELGRAGRWGGVFLHHMSGPDPGKDLHDHPWWFASLVLKGGYLENRALTRDSENEVTNERRRWSWRSLPLTQAHTIWKLLGDTWTLVIHGPRRQDWGFYTPDGWVFHKDYDNTRRGLKAELVEEVD
jgi:hypothetical protein